MRKLRRWIQSKLHGYDLPELVKPKPLAIKPTDKICILARMRTTKLSAAAGCWRCTGRSATLSF